MGSLRNAGIAAGALVTAAAVVLAPTAPAGPPAPAIPVAASLAVCPELTVTEDSDSVVTGVIGALPDEDEGAQGSAALSHLAGGPDLARVLAPGRPATLLLAGRSQPPLLFRAGGTWAGHALAGTATADTGGIATGLSSAQCSPPDRQWWFVGAGSQVRRGSALLVANSSDEPARFDISLYARSGPVPALAGRAIDLGPRSHVRMRLDALAEEQDLLAVHVSATSGQIAVSLRDVEVPQGDSPRGVDFIPRAVAPSTTLHLAGIPGGAGARELVLVNPGSQFATVSTALTTADGQLPLAGLESVAIPAGSVVSIPVAAQLAGRSATLTMVSDVPITGGIRSSWGTAVRDVSWLSATPGLSASASTSGAAAVPVGPGLVTTVTVAALGEAVSGTLGVTLAESADEPVIGSTEPSEPSEPAEPEGSAEPAATPSAEDDSEAFGPQLVTASTRDLDPIPVDVPAGTQRVITIPDPADAALATLTWRSAAGSGPVLLTHLTLDEAVPRATGYSWWPIPSSVAGVAVREDIGVLAHGR